MDNKKEELFDEFKMSLPKTNVRNANINDPQDPTVPMNSRKSSSNNAFSSGTKKKLFLLLVSS